MYVLKFRVNRSKYFKDALATALDMGAVVENGMVILKVGNVLGAYAEIRTLFSFVQNWKGTSATYNGKAVHPYQFILYAHWVENCYEERIIDGDCGNKWGCLKLDEKHFQWWKYGKFVGVKWWVDKPVIRLKLLKFAQDKGIDICPFFDELQILKAVANLPDFIMPEGKGFEIEYKEREGVELPVGINKLHP